MKENTVPTNPIPLPQRHELQGHFELCSCTKTLLSEIADKGFRRFDVAQSYWLALRSSEPTDWKAVNQAIIERWSLSALNRIKEFAWKPQMPSCLK